ncbi:hypothetical protein ACVNIS_00760 [Sphaerotilaceae bacterium SBD11-9]
MPTSTAPEGAAGDTARIERAVETALRHAGSGDATTRLLRSARVGAAALARTPGGEPAFWLVPFERDGLACGYARVGLDGRVGQLSQFGSGEADRGAWPPASFFRQPPAPWLAQIGARHPGEALAEPLLSYDGVPARWAWRIALGDGARVAFVSTGGWYEKPAEPGSGEQGIA